MDVKSLAKSKRAHSQHHSKKHHPNQKPKAPSTGSTGVASPSNPPAKHVKEKTPQIQSSSGLLSNWDRYEEDFDLETDDSLHNNSRELSDAVKRKSKGADYSYLISEAKSQSHAASSSLSFPSLDEIFNDFNQGFGALVSVRGENILSQIQNDSFIVEDQSTSNYEAAFLSLDLNSIAKQLEKVDLSHRLFIDEEQDFMLLQELSTATEPLDQHIDITIMSSSSAAPTAAAFSGTPATSTFPSTEPNIHYVPNPNQSVAAEAELDMLLNSFGDTNYLGSSGPSTMNQTRLDDQDLSRSRLVSNLDSTIDDLLNETSTPIHEEINSSAVNGPVLSKPVLGSNLDDSIDDLLSETASSSLTNKSGPAEVSIKPLDDFDSWLDTI